jgi:hypothetical protein
MRVFTRQHTTVTTASTTKHFDLLMSACIAWAMKDFAQITTDFDDLYAQAEIEEAKERNMTI